jgi:hypothetical protein
VKSKNPVKKANASLFDVRKNEKTLNHFRFNEEHEVFLKESKDLFGVPYYSVEEVWRGKKTVVAEKKNNLNAAYQVYHRIEKKFLWE